MAKESASQTAGPYVHIGLTPNFAGIGGVYSADLGISLVGDGARGDRITITGHVYDGAGEPLRDAVVEIWQADAGGLHNSPAEKRGAADPHFAGWGRCPTDSETGLYKFETIKPGRVPHAGNIFMAPHITFWIVARGINVGLQTRMYFADETEANAQDPLLAKINPSERVATLLAARDGAAYTFDIYLQGERETIFLDI
jgi:protocatechuate 3,4-dioxygenase alpha subunit